MMKRSEPISGQHPATSFFTTTFALLLLSLSRYLIGPLNGRTTKFPSPLWQWKDKLMKLGPSFSPCHFISFSLFQTAKTHRATHWPVHDAEMQIEMIAPAISGTVYIVRVMSIHVLRMAPNKLHALGTSKMCRVISMYQLRVKLF